MRFRLLPLFPLAGALLFFSACASTPPSAGLESGTVIQGTFGPRTMLNGESVPSLEGTLTSSSVLRDGNGGVIVTPGVDFERRDDGYTDARELKLKIRELAEQLVADMRDCSLQGTVALPTSFVSLNNFDETSTFGRLMGEQLIYELNQRGYPVREYRQTGAIRQKKEGEFYLARSVRSLAPGNAVVVVGTYSEAPEAVFVNARLVRPKDGRVLRTANLVLRKNAIVGKMMRSGRGSASAAAGIGACNVGIKDFASVTRPKEVVSLDPFDRGEDVH